MTPTVKPVDTTRPDFDPMHPLKGRVICVDGPSSCGKGTLAKALAREYRLKFLDTGCLYRSVALRLIEQNVPESDLDAAVREAQWLSSPGHFDFRHVGNNRFAILLAGDDVSERVRTLDVGLRASLIAGYMPLRLALRTFQQDFVKTWAPVYGVVLDGRDTGSKIAPDADLKLMMQGDPIVRAHWRLKDYKEAGKETTYGEVLADLVSRDERDAANMQVFPETVCINCTEQDAVGVYAMVEDIICATFGVGPVPAR